MRLHPYEYGRTVNDLSPPNPKPGWEVCEEMIIEGKRHRFWRRWIGQDR